MDEGFSRHRGNNNELIQLALRRCLSSAHSVFPFFQSGRANKLQSVIIAYILNQPYSLDFLNLWNEISFWGSFSIKFRHFHQVLILLYYAMWLVQNFTLPAENEQLKLVKTWKTRPFVMHRSSWSLNTPSPGNPQEFDYRPCLGVGNLDIALVTTTVKSFQRKNLFYLLMWR